MTHLPGDKRENGKNGTKFETFVFILSFILSFFSLASGFFHYVISILASLNLNTYFIRTLEVLQKGLHFSISGCSLGKLSFKILFLLRRCHDWSLQLVRIRNVKHILSSIQFGSLSLKHNTHAILLLRVLFQLWSSFSLPWMSRRTIQKSVPVSETGIDKRTASFNRYQVRENLSVFCIYKGIGCQRTLLLRRVFCYGQKN